MDKWERQSGEPNLWFDRFEHYRLCGAGRSVDQAYRRWRDEQPAGTKGAKSTVANRHWYEAARRWDWLVRAEAWDESERERVRALESQQRFDARQRRLRAIAEQLEAGLHALDVAGLAKLNGERDEDVEMALRMLPTVRLLVTEMMRAQRLEYGEATEIVQGPSVSDEVAAALEKAYGGGKKGA